MLQWAECPSAIRYDTKTGKWTIAYIDWLYNIAVHAHGININKSSEDW